MRVPGFTAHDSLYRSNRRYAEGSVSSWSPPEVALPALPIGGGGCNPVCLGCKGCGEECFNPCTGVSFSRVCNCPVGNTCCGWNPETGGGRCTDLSSDLQSCGSCFHACPPGNHCSDYLCCPPGQDNAGGICCPSGQGLTNCDGVCVNLSNDLNNCGACGQECLGEPVQCQAIYAYDTPGACFQDVNGLPLGHCQCVDQCIDGQCITVAQFFFPPLDPAGGACTGFLGRCTGPAGPDSCITVQGVTQCCHSNWLGGNYPLIIVCPDGYIYQSCETCQPQRDSFE